MDYNYLTTFLMVFARITAFIVVFPIFAVSGIPVQTRIGLGFVLSLVLTPVVGVGFGADSVLGFVLDMAGETLIGLAIGLTSAMVFQAIRMAGQLTGMQVGFAMAEMLDISGQQNTIVAELMFFMGVIVFFSINGHHAVLTALAKSFSIIPLGGGVVKGSTMIIVARCIGGMFSTALQLAAPILAVMVVVDVSLGIMVRMVPQINVFMIGFPLKVFAGLFMMAGLLPVMGFVLSKIFERMVADVLIITRGLA
ncbi:MAG: flagellar biosynthetic protein FliR [Bacillota bacterium]